jgi:hypothetical protein
MDLKINHLYEKTVIFNFRFKVKIIKFHSDLKKNYYYFYFYF